MDDFDFTTDLILENERVQLRPLKEIDIEFLSGFSLNEPELWNYSLLPGSGLENLKKYIEFALNGRKAKTSYPFVVFDKRMGN
jgi:hypothetical protein